MIPDSIAVHGDLYALSGEPVEVDTPVGSFQAKTFDALLSEPAPRINGLLVSSDLPFTLNRFQANEGLKALVAGSDYYCDFGSRYGVLIADPRILARAVFVLDASCVVRYVEVVDEIAHEPNYSSAIEALIPLL